MSFRERHEACQEGLREGRDPLRGPQARALREAQREAEEEGPRREEARHEEGAQELVAPAPGRDAMALREKLDEDLKSAMRAKDSLRMNTVRGLKSAIKYREIELMKPLDDAGILGVVSTEIKRRRDSVEQYRAGNRPDLAEKEEAEIKILQEFLPQQLTPAEVEAKVAEVNARVGAQGPKDMGAVMKALLPEVQGRADGKVVSELVKQRLAGR